MKGCSLTERDGNDFVLERTVVWVPMKKLLSVLTADLAEPAQVLGKQVTVGPSIVDHRSFIFLGWQCSLLVPFSNRASAMGVWQ